MNWTEDDYAEYQKKKGVTGPGVILEKVSKLHSKKTKADGICFDSTKEADFYNDLKLQLHAGTIKGFCIQPQFILQAGFGVERPITYTADFIVFNLDNTAEIIDTKGFETEAFTLRRKMFADKFRGLELKVIK
jgi:hypothetical protein